MVLLDIVAPIFGVVLAGYAMARSRLLSPEGVRGISDFVFYAAIPRCCSAPWRRRTRRQVPTWR
jgi:predicted permease